MERKDNNIIRCRECGRRGYKGPRLVCARGPVRGIVRPDDFCAWAVKAAAAPALSEAERAQFARRTGLLEEL